jgi:copper chaperone CopZ
MLRSMTRTTLALAASAVLAFPLLAETLTFKVVGVDCAECAPPVTKALKKLDGVKNVKVDGVAQTATIDVPANYPTAKIRAALQNAGFDAEFPGEQRSAVEALPESIVKTLDIRSYDGKQKIDVRKAVAPGKITIIDFYGEWCGPCRVLETRLQHLLNGKPNLALRRVDIGHWDNAAAKQATREFRTEALPYVRVYDAKGKFVESVTGGMWDEVLAAIAKAEAR